MPEQTKTSAKINDLLQRVPGCSMKYWNSERKHA
jgi:hypothetical protein